MVARTPLILDGGNLKEMSSSQITEIQNRCRYLYGANPSVVLSHTASGGNLSPGMSDTRMRAGVTSSGASSFPAETSTDEPTIITVTTYDRVNQTAANTTETADTSNIAFPVYRTNTNDIQAMTLTEMYETFIYPAIDTITSAVGQPGTYRVHTSNSLTGYTNLGTIFSDTRVIPANYSAASIPAAGQTYADQVSGIADFYLLSSPNIAAPTYTSPVYIRSDNNIQQYTQTAFDAILKNCMRHVASEVTGSKIRYILDTNNIEPILGTAITDTKLNGSGNYQTHEAGADDYRAAEFPNGTAVTATTWYLRMVQE